MSLNDPDWLSLEPVLDPTPNRALYPYPLLNNILSAADCREAVIDETASLEQEFGRDLVEPIYQLLWRVNTIEDVFTSHLSVSPPDYEPPFVWAKCFVGTSIVILPRKQADRHERRAAEGMANMLGRAFLGSRFIPRDTAGLQIRLFPTTVDLAYQIVMVDSKGSVFPTNESEWQIGYGHEIVISGSAGTRRRAAERWSRTTVFVLQTLASLREAPPHQHFSIVEGERALPASSQPQGREHC